SVLYRGKKQLFQILDLALRNLFLFSPVLTQIPVPLTLVASYKNVSELLILPHQLNQWLYPVKIDLYYSDWITPLQHRWLLLVLSHDDVHHTARAILVKFVKIPQMLAHPLE